MFGISIEQAGSEFRALLLLVARLATLQARSVDAAQQQIPLSVLSFWLNGAQISNWNLSMTWRLFVTNTPPPVHPLGRMKIRWQAPVRNLQPAGRSDQNEIE
jgi:hypothetical protein